MPDPLEPQREAFSIVVLGDFNPAIFQPLWFWVNNLFAKEEANEAQLGVVSKEVASFAIGGITIQVTSERLGLTITEPQLEPVLRDLAIGILSLLEHTPLNAMGFNRDMIFGLDSIDSRNNIGFTLVPVKNWETILEPEGMIHLVFQGKRSERPSDRVQFRIRPSGEVPYGVFVGVNQHYQLTTPSRTDVRSRHDEAIRALSDDWKSFTAYARDAACQLLSKTQDKPT